MIRHFVLLAFWAASPTPGQVGSTALYTEFEHKPSPAVVLALQSEVDALLGADGLSFEWRSLPANDQRTWTELAVLKFSGRCEALPFASNSHPDHRLGWTHISDGEILPFAEIDCDAIRAFVLKDLFTVPADSREQVFGRATGRVTAHELLHIFARSAEHGAHGVDHPTLSAADLLGDHLIFDEREPSLHIVHGKPGSPPGIGPGSAAAGKISYVRNGCVTCHGAKGEGGKQAPILRTAGRLLNSIVLKAKLAKSESKMCKQARTLKLSPPSLPEEEISDLIRYLNEIDQ